MELYQNIQKWCSIGIPAEDPLETNDVDSQIYVITLSYCILIRSAIKERQYCFESRYLSQSFMT